MADTAAGNTTTTTTGQDTTSEGTDTSTTATTTDTAAAGSSTTETITGDNKDWKAQAEKWRALARKHEATAKENAEAKTKLREIEESQKTEQQKLTDRLAEAEKELAGHRLLAIRTAAAREAGLDSDMAEYLTESDPEAALKQAKALAKRIAPSKPDLRQGARGGSAKPAEDMNAWLRRAAGYSSTP